MANEARKKQALDRIRENIARTGQHVYVISGGETPRFAYTIGVSESIGFELIFAGGIFYMKDEVVKILNDIAAQLKARRDGQIFEVAELGSFTLRNVDASWAAEFILGVFDYYHRRDIPALQIVPDKQHWTIDVPDLSEPWSASAEPVWQWLKQPWSFPVPKDATAATNLADLRGERITEVTRWEEDEWEMFAGAGPDVTEEEMRVVALGTLIAADKSLNPAMHLAKGEGLWRDPDPDSEWHPWLNKGEQGTGTIQ